MAGRDIIQIGPAGAGAAAARDNKMQGGTDMADKSIVLYFSVSSNTRAVAEIIRAQTGRGYRGDPAGNALYRRIQRAGGAGEAGDPRRLPAAGCRTGARPVRIRRDLSGHAQLVEHYRSAVASLLEKYDLAGRRIAPFITHGGGGKGHAERDLRALCPAGAGDGHAGRVRPGGADTAQAVAAWIARNRI